MRSFREVQRSIPSAPKRQWACPPEAPQGAANKLGASGLKKNPTLHLQSERHTSRDSTEAATAWKQAEP